MSRESSASLSVANVAGLPERPPAPEFLSAPEADVWRDTVATKPADWFLRDSQPILAQYCKAVVLHRELSAKLDRIDIQAVEPKDLEKLVAMVCKVAALASNLATKMRLTQQSRYTPDRAATANKRNLPARPWETGKSDAR